MSLRPTSTIASCISHRIPGPARDGGVAATAAMPVAVLAGVLAFAIDLDRTFDLKTDGMDIAGHSNSADIWD